MNSLEQFMKKLWFSEKHRSIFLATYTYGPSPASSIAQLTTSERSYTYKVLQDFIRQWLVKETTIRWTKQFYVPDNDVLLHVVKKRTKRLEDLEKEYPEIRKELSQLDTQKIPYIPKMEMFDWEDWIDRRFGDMRKHILREHILVLKFYGSDVFASEVDRFADIEESYQLFLSFLEEKKLWVHAYIGEWVLTVEGITHAQHIERLQTLPIGNQSAQMRVVWTVMYIWLFKAYPIWFKIQSPDIANMMHVILEHTT